MPVIRSSAASEYEVHGATFSAYASPRTGSSELCAWSVTIPANSSGALHRPGKEEILLVLYGEVRVTLDGETITVLSGDVVIVPATCEFRIDGGASESKLWVTTSAGFDATMADGSRFIPPWAG